MDHVKAEQYYKDDGDKTKLNWFCYEYANNLYMEISASKKLTKYRDSHSEKEIAAFCTYFSKRMRKSIHDTQIGRTKNIAIDAMYVYEFYPKNSTSQTQSLLEAAVSAWKEQILSCNGCSTRCLDDGYEICGMFDRLAETGWPT
jgi:hypothetical protein